MNTGPNELRQRRPVQKDPGHLKKIRKLHCLRCAKSGPSEAAHIRYADRKRGKRYTGMAEKPDDKYTVPLCGGCHRYGSDAQHHGNEKEWWLNARIDPIAVAMKLYECETQDEMEGVIIDAIGFIF